MTGYEREAVLKFPRKDGLGGKLLSAMSRPIELALGFDRFNSRYTALPQAADALEFASMTLRELAVTTRTRPDELARIPESGPVLVVANHPFGGIEGLVLADLLRRRRPDVKIMANYLLGRIPDLAEILILVDPFGHGDAAARNLRPLRQSMAWLRSGGLLGVFPAGEVSHWQPGRGGVADPEWSPTIARMIRKAGVPVLPIYFDGGNGPLFHLAGLAHPRLRTALLPRELLNKSGREINLKIGKLITPEKMAEYPTDADLTTFLRLRTYNLKHAATAEKRRFFSGFSGLLRKPQQEIAPETDPDGVSAELISLPKGQILAENGGFKVYCAYAAEIPLTLREIGRLREITFRGVGEGTGLPLDLDPFDDYYLHLVLWDDAAGCIAGGYRLGLTDEIRPRFGKKGMYTHTLFKYKKAFLSAIEPGIELGRSFVRPEYQRHPTALPLMWRAIGAFVAVNPRYRHLFGPVSISGAYKTASRRYMVEFLRKSRLHADLARLVKGRTPPKYRGELSGSPVDQAVSVLNDIDDVSGLIAEIEPNLTGIPILLKHYLKLGGRMLAFNVDKKFCNCVDGLILVDLVQTEKRMLDRYLGREAATAFLAYHAQRHGNPTQGTFRPL